MPIMVAVSVGMENSWLRLLGRQEGANSTGGLADLSVQSGRLLCSAGSPITHIHGVPFCPIYFRYIAQRAVRQVNSLVNRTRFLRLSGHAWLSRKGKVKTDAAGIR